ncbi:MAG: hypothetical protein CFE45_03620 [Burkholderiales bacterium PBB5]|nr:MAG: hypothetical protein CFE45_03620 [Burkholderiales bacterium PBB5]
MPSLSRNLPGWERLLRLAIAATLAGLAVLGLTTGWATVAVLAAAAGTAITALAGFCPACAMVGRRPQRRAP